MWTEDFKCCLRCHHHHICSKISMKTLGVMVGTLLLLFMAYSTTAMPHGPNDMTPGTCCFKFFPKRIPEAHILSIVKTHGSCSKKGFVINTPKGKYCVSQTEKWANKAFNESY
ncbi:C-C motif chemokine 3 [Kryptolebias marmoratus]|uniref:C-C motif chemokine 3 n=1 Tax=Kryptolebias marmoratus TaxID=37003 RepID=UPI000D52F3A2|nr:C-C motif chemokine 3 [Kryptolebias marmoratus]